VAIAHLRNPESAAAHLRNPDTVRVALPPRWWFIVLPLEAAPCWVFGTALWGIIWPKQIQIMFGDHEKIRITGLLSTVSNTLGWSAPFLGTLSDRFPEHWARRCGRRRPFILVGQTICAVSLLVTYTAVRPYLIAHQKGEVVHISGGSHTTLMLLICSQVIGSIGGNVEGPAWGAVWYDTIPPKQRGMLRLVEAMFCTTCCIIGDLVGWGVGQGYIMPDTIFRIYIAVEFYRIPMKLIACSGEAGWCKPELLPPPKPTPKPDLDPHNPHRQIACCAKGPTILWRETLEFLSAFQEPSFAWMWIHGERPL
jgi:MFS family permease